MHISLSVCCEERAALPGRGRHPSCVRDVVISDYYTSHIDIVCIYIYI